MEQSHIINYLLIYMTLLGAAAGAATGSWLIFKRHLAQGHYLWICEWRNWFDINRQLGVTLLFSTVSCVGYMLLMTDWILSSCWENIGMGATLAWMVYHLLTARSIVGFHQIVNRQQQEIQRLRNELRHQNK